MSKAPAFQFYPKDYESDERVKMMSLAQEGAFLRLLCHAWLHESIPSDIDSLARICRVPRSKMNRLWPGVSQCFVSNGEGRLVNPRQERDRTSQAEHRKERAESGRLGAEKKKEKAASSAKAQLPNPTSLASPQLQANASSPSPSAVSVLHSARLNERSGPPANPFLGPGDKERLASECMALVRKLASLTGEEPLDVMARASGYEGATRTKVNPASMSDDRLINTVRDLKADIAAEEKRRGASKSAGL